jgi:hypothetical protein
VLRRGLLLYPGERLSLFVALLVPLVTLTVPTPSSAVLVCGTDAELVAANGYELVRANDWTLGQPIGVTAARPGEDPHLDTLIGPYEHLGCGSFHLEVLIVHTDPIGLTTSRRSS